MTPEPKTPPSLKKRVFILAIIVLIFGGLLGGSLAVYEKFLEDREKARLFERRSLPRRTPGQPVREVKEYSAEELEEAQKRGELPKTVPIPQPAQNQSNLDAVQRSLRTVEEINRINEQNRRIMEQNQRLNNR